MKTLSDSTDNLSHWSH